MTIGEYGLTYEYEPPQDELEEIFYEIVGAIKNPTPPWPVEQVRREALNKTFYEVEIAGDPAKFIFGEDVESSISIDYTEQILNTEEEMLKANYTISIYFDNRAVNPNANNNLLETGMYTLSKVRIPIRGNTTTEGFILSKTAKELVELKNVPEGESCLEIDATTEKTPELSDEEAEIEQKLYEAMESVTAEDLLILQRIASILQE